MRKETGGGASAGRGRRGVRGLRSRAATLGLAAGCAWGLPLLASCSGASEPSPPQTISREAFVAAYVDLRVAALRDPAGRLAPERRDSILAGHGLTQEDLLEFVDVRGRDVDYMREIWNTVDRLITEAGSPPDTVS